MDHCDDRQQFPRHRARGQGVQRSRSSDVAMTSASTMNLERMMCRLVLLLSGSNLLLFGVSAGKLNALPKVPLSYLQCIHYYLALSYFISSYLILSHLHCIHYYIALSYFILSCISYLYLNLGPCMLCPIFCVPSNYSRRVLSGLLSGL